MDPVPETPVDVVLTGAAEGVPAEPTAVEPLGVVVPVPPALGVEAGSDVTGVADGSVESAMRGGVPGP